MAVLKIKVVSIIGRMTELDQVTSICGKSGCFHPDNSLSFYSDTAKFSPITEENPYAEPLQRLSGAVNGSRKRLELLPQDELNKIQYRRDELEDYVTRLVSSFQELQDARVAAQEQIQRCTRDMEEVSHFTGLDLDLDAIRECRYIKVRFGRLPKDSYEKLNHYHQNPYVIFFPCTSDDIQYWGVYFAPMEQVSEVDRIFSSLYFERIRLSELHSTPEHMLEDLQAERGKAIERIKAVDSRIEALWKQEQKELRRVYSYLNEQSVFFSIRRYAARYNDSFILTGWIPAEREKDFCAQLDQLESVEYTLDKAENELEHSPPVKLKNKKLIKPFEFFVDMFGLPQYDELDPTPFVAITYVLLFGIMFGDVGQGLCVSLVGYLMWRLKGMALGKALIPCGISSAFFGLVFGSVFGYEHLLDPMYQALFHLSEKPIEVMEADTTIQIILAAVCIGIFLVLCAILINIICSLRRHRYESALFGPNGVAGFVFYGGLVAGFGGQLAFGWQLVTPLYVAVVLILPLLVMMFAKVLGALVEHKPDWKPESWGGYVMENFFELFEVLLGYASNTISFLRVGAFVLVHAGMMTMVFTLADMTSGIGYVLIVVLGNAVVAGMEGLLVGIQVMRLEFYEMFSRFFEGGGRPFRPVTLGPSR
ncbi:MAG TPA: ATPase [Candidatus Caccousia avistercoris]|nr:ATPase [Candidatus Caccousia avistercoris]